MVERASYDDAGAIKGDDKKWYKPKDSFKNVTAVSSITQNPKLLPNDLSDDVFDCTVEVPTFLAAYAYYVTYDYKGDRLFTDKQILKAGDESDLKDQLNREAYYWYSSSAEPEKAYEHLRAGNWPSYDNGTHWTDITVKLTIK